MRKLLCKLKPSGTVIIIEKERNHQRIPDHKRNQLTKRIRTRLDINQVGGKNMRNIMRFQDDETAYQISYS